MRISLPSDHDFSYSLDKRIVFQILRPNKDSTMSLHLIIHTRNLDHLPSRIINRAFEGKYDEMTWMRLTVDDSTFFFVYEVMMLMVR